MVKKRYAEADGLPPGVHIYRFKLTEKRVPTRLILCDSERNDGIELATDTRWAEDETGPHQSLCRTWLSPIAAAAAMLLNP